MRKMRILSAAALATICGLSLVSAASAAQTYTDALGDNYGGPEVDIQDVVVSNDANNITFHIDLNPAANIGPTANRFANYEVGIQEFGGFGGQTAINGTFGTGNPAAGNPYGNSVGISSGEQFFIGSFLAGTTFNGGAQLYAYSSITGWSQIGPTAPNNQMNTGTPFQEFTFPLSALGLNIGDSFNFDVWDSFGSPQGAYDALDNAIKQANTPFGGTPAYDSATAPGSTFATTIYTVTAPMPEPMSLGMFAGLAGMALVRRRRAN